MHKRSRAIATRLYQSPSHLIASRSLRACTTALSKSGTGSHAYAHKRSRAIATRSYQLPSRPVASTSLRPRSTALSKSRTASQVYVYKRSIAIAARFSQSYSRLIAGRSLRALARTINIHANLDINIGIALAQISDESADTSRTSYGSYRTTGRYVRLYSAALAVYRRYQTVACSNIRQRQAVRQGELSYQAWRIIDRPRGRDRSSYNPAAISFLRF